MKKVKIIIEIENIETFASLVEKLKVQNIEIMMAFNEREFSDLLETENVNIIIIAYEMTDMNTFQVIRKMRHERKLSKIYIISKKDMTKECKSQNINFVKQPSEINKIVELINVIIK